MASPGTPIKRAAPKPTYRRRTATPRSAQAAATQAQAKARASATPAPTAAPKATAQPKSPWDLIQEVFKPRFGTGG